MISTPKWLGLLAVAFVAGSFIASPELRAFAANTVGSSDIINESIQSVDIKNGEVKASDIATDAVGAAEIQGVNKLLFGECSLTGSEAITPVQAGNPYPIFCSISGVDSNDFPAATLVGGNTCFGVIQAVPDNGRVVVWLKNDCDTEQKVNAAKISVIVFDK